MTNHVLKYCHRIAYSMVLIFLLMILSCKNQFPEPIVEATETLAASIQRAGNVEQGYDYLVNGNYVDSGIPFDLWISLRGENAENILKRQGDNAKIGYGFNVVTTSNNTRVVGANCLNCHASTINNEFVMGL